MKKILITLLSVALGAGLLQAAAFEKEAKFRETKVHISSDKPLTTGSNTLIFKVLKNGKALQGSKVNVKAFMPAMPGMPAMASKAEAIDLGEGKYEAKLNLTMGGTWQLHIFILPSEGKKSRVKTSLNF